MAKAHEIIHEKKHSDHKEQWSQDIETGVAAKMATWRGVHNVTENAGHRTLNEFKQETRIRTELVLDRALVEVKQAFEAIQGAETPRPGAGLSGALPALFAVAEDKKHTGLVKLDKAMEDVAEGKPDFALVWFCVALVDVLTSLTDAGVVAGEYDEVAESADLNYRSEESGT